MAGVFKIMFLSLPGNDFEKDLAKFEVSMIFSALTKIDTASANSAGAGKRSGGPTKIPGIYKNCFANLPGKSCIFKNGF